METLLNVYDWIGRILALPGLIALCGIIYSLLTGTLLILYRLGRGLQRRSIAIFANSNGELSVLKAMLTSSGYFKEHDIIEVSDLRMRHRAWDAHLFLVSWQDWSQQLPAILEARSHTRGVALIIYASPNAISPPDMATLAQEHNTIVVNFPARLLNDVIMSLITTSLTRYRRNATP